MKKFIVLVVVIWSVVTLAGMAYDSAASDVKQSTEQRLSQINSI